MFLLFFNDAATTEIYTLSLHDALPICDEGGRGRLEPGAPRGGPRRGRARGRPRARRRGHAALGRGDRKSTRLNSSHTVISYAVFCLKKKTKQRTMSPMDIQEPSNSAAK